MTGRGRQRREDPAAKAVAAGWALVRGHPLFAPLTGLRVLTRQDDGVVPRDGWAVIDSDGTVHVHPTRRGQPAEWAWIFAHLLLHLGMNHHKPETSGGTTFDLAHTAACDVVVHRFQDTLKFGTCPIMRPADLPPGDETTLAGRWREEGVPGDWAGCGASGSAPCIRQVVAPRWARPVDFPALFAAGLTAAVTAAVDLAGGARESMTSAATRHPPWTLARSWFIASYPLLAAVVSTLTVVADAELARGWDIAIAAVSPTAGELYVNPHAQLTEDEWRFVIAHEALHAALAHHARIGGRHPDLFNIACDFVVNGWLIEMRVGAMPAGSLHDPQFAGQSAEQVYDHIARQARRYRKLATLRGRGGGDVLGDALPRRVDPAAGVDLDGLLRRSLLAGLDLHIAGQRGTLPAALVQEIQALAHPPITWDVALARWFDEHFPAAERSRTYSRLSRRSAATPGIPRPGYRLPEELLARRTFGVVLDTSMSMTTTVLGKALGAIASYAATHDVPAARVVYCDAAAYDAGYLSPDDIAGRVRITGRGGTILQPGIDLIERARDFPADGPILVITDGVCDTLRVRREHAYLIPAGASLPFTAKGPVFRID
jgi:predicted metal-dependent peptidase